MTGVQTCALPISNDEFPNGASIIQGIEEVVNEAGGKVIFSPNGDTSIKADAVIAVYGEDPYAEFQGDRENLDFVPNGFDVNKLAAYKNKGIPVVSVFLCHQEAWIAHLADPVSLMLARCLSCGGATCGVRGRTTEKTRGSIRGAG